MLMLPNPATASHRLEVLFQQWAESYFLRTLVISNVLHLVGLVKSAEVSNHPEPNRIKNNNTNGRHVMTVLQGIVNPLQIADKDSLHNTATGKSVRVSSKTEIVLLKMKALRENGRNSFIK